MEHNLTCSREKNVKSQQGELTRQLGGQDSPTGNEEADVNLAINRTFTQKLLKPSIQSTTQVSSGALWSYVKVLTPEQVLVMSRFLSFGLFGLDHNGMKLNEPSVTRPRRVLINGDLESN